MTATASAPMVLPFNVTSAVQSWYSGTANNGIALKRTSGMTNAIAFKGYNSETYIGPLLEISYEPVLNGTFYMRNVELNKYVLNLLEFCETTKRGIHGARKRNAEQEDML